MTCSTCGRENPAHLTFCQECGQRLGPRIAPPTPPIGLGGHDAYGPPPNAAAAPPRVATSLGMTSNMPDPTPPPPQVGRAATGGDERRCRVCDTANGPNHRYCTSCGSTLDPAPVALAAAAPPARAAIPSPANAIVPAGVVNLAGAAPAAATRICGRCKGTADATAQFCRVLNVLETGGEWRPFIMAEIGVGRAGGEHEIIEGDWTLAGAQDLTFAIDAFDTGHQHGEVVLSRQHVAYRPCNVRGRQDRGRDLIQQRLETVIIVLVD